MPRNKYPDDKSHNPFASALRKLMTERDIKQEGLAKITGKTRQTISQYTNGISEPGYETLVKIADYFDVSTDFLLGRTTDPNRSPCATDDLGLTPDFIDWIVNMNENENTRVILNNIFEIPSFRLLVSELCNYYCAARAADLYDRIWFDFFADYSDTDDLEMIHQEFKNEIDRIIESNQYEERISSMLSIHSKTWEATEKWIPSKGKYCREGLSVIDIYTLKANKQMENILTDIDLVASFKVFSEIELIDSNLKETLIRE